jgi:hypothetical protein
VEGTVLNARGTLEYNHIKPDKLSCPQETYVLVRETDKNSRWVIWQRKTKE